ncbi:hypothetical protein D3C77_244070 [compost metagenome]
MTLTVEGRVAQLRQAAINCRRNPNDLFEARMAIHEALEALGVNSNRICDLLISERPPLTDWDCNRLEMVASLVEAEPEARAEHLFGLCEMVAMVAPS